MSYADRCDVSVLVGKTLTEINVDNQTDEITFCCLDGDKYKMFHDQDCCEGVNIEDVNGDIADLVGSPIVLAEESTNSETDPEDHVGDHQYRDSFTWTFYRFATAKGFVTIRWYGESNGYYSESVSFEKLT